MTRVGMRPFYRFTSTIVRWLAKLIFGLRVYGLENIPRTGRMILVSNHVSELDPPIIGACIPREMFFAAKIQLFKKPFWDWFFRYHNGIPIRRQGSDTEAIKKLVKCLREDKGVLIFPEGTRTLDPDGIEAKAGVGMIAVLSKADIVPCRIDGTHDYKKHLFKSNSVILRFGEKISFNDIADQELPKKENYRLIADKVMESIKALRQD